MPMYDELYHHGIAGQKWGVRHGPPYPVARSSDGRAKAIVSTNKRQMTKGTRKAYSGVKITKNEESRISVKNARRSAKMQGYVKVSSLTDEQLTARIKRLELEKKYKDLLRKPEAKKTSSEGKKVLYNTLGSIATTTVTAAVNATLGRLAGAPKKPRDSLGAVITNAAADKFKNMKSTRELVNAQEKAHYAKKEGERRAEERLNREEAERAASRVASPYTEDMYTRTTAFNRAIAAQTVRDAFEERLRQNSDHMNDVDTIARILRS